jgi:hypothetical protein
MACGAAGTTVEAWRNRCAHPRRQAASRRRRRSSRERLH